MGEDIPHRQARLGWGGSLKKMIVICLLYNFHLFSTHGMGKIEIGKMLEGYKKGEAIDFLFLPNASADLFFFYK